MKIWIFNIGIEKKWGSDNLVRDPIEDRLVNKIEQIMLLLAESKDLVIFREYPEQSCLDYLNRLGIVSPTIMVCNLKDDSQVITDLILQDVMLLKKLKRICQNEECILTPYALTNAEVELASILHCTIISAKADVVCKINSKIFAKKFSAACGFNILKGKICSSKEEVNATYLELKEIGFSKVVIKQEYGASGKGLYVFESWERLEKYLKHVFYRNKKENSSDLIIEGWYDTKTDINYQFYISREGNVENFTITEQEVKGTVYIGTKYAGETQWYFKYYFEFAQIIGKKLFEFGYWGPISIDSMISNGVIYPIIEINGRFSLSSYLTVLPQKLQITKYRSRYYNVSLTTELKYKSLLDYLEQGDLLYTKKKKRGILIYILAITPDIYNKDKRLYLGRIFALSIADNWEEIDILFTKLEKKFTELEKEYENCIN